MDLMDGPMQFNKTSVNDIWKFKKDHTWKQVGNRYGVSGDAIRRRAIRFQEHQEISRKAGSRC